jgi:AraC family transcriptional regulator of adaptative response/methylated-DNA-[protein]-cysteine methyltransferase
MVSEQGICGLGFAAALGRSATEADLRARWPKARVVEDSAHVRAAVEAAISPRKDRAARLALIGAPFQVKVWEALLAIPSGQVATYSDIATAIGNPKAVRAVGTAIGRNPISWLIPCHRALRKSGALGGYHWGLDVKRALLAYESARADALPFGDGAADASAA